VATLVIEELPSTLAALIGTQTNETVGFDAAARFPFYSLSIYDLIIFETAFCVTVLELGTNLSD
jgi:hypothetical protein